MAGLEDLVALLSFYLVVSVIFALVGLLMYRGARGFPPDVNRPLARFSIRSYEGLAHAAPIAVPAGLTAWILGLLLHTQAGPGLHKVGFLLHFAGFLAAAFPLLMIGVLRGHQRRKSAGPEGGEEEPRPRHRSATTKVAARYGLFALVTVVFWWTGAFEDGVVLYGFLAIAVLGVTIDVVRYGVGRSSEE